MNITFIILAVGYLIASVLKHYFLAQAISQDIENERNSNND